MGTKMQKIESRSYSSSILQARKLWKITTSCGARGPSHNPHLRPAQQQHSLSSMSVVVLGTLSQILSQRCLLLAERKDVRQGPASAFLTSTSAAASASQPIESFEKKFILIIRHQTGLVQYDTLQSLFEFGARAPKSFLAPRIEILQLRFCIFYIQVPIFETLSFIENLTSIKSSFLNELKSKQFTHIFRELEKNL